MELNPAGDEDRSHLRRLSGRVLGRLNFWTKDKNLEPMSAETCFLPRALIESITYIKANGLQTIGIFRVPGDAQKVDMLQAAYDNGQVNVLHKHDCSVHDVATLLKKSIRNMEEPLLPFAAYKKFLKVARKYERPTKTPFLRHKRSESNINATDRCESSEKDPASVYMASKRARQVCDITLTLPPPQCRTLSMILNLLYMISLLSEDNRMTAQALAVVFAPTLMQTPDNISPQTVLREMPIAIAATKILIENASALPQSLLSTAA
mmetsp:Transcript_31996/g.51007  ORF Transcript_31996/g.51007 Transcript_31996/m.51007 type:complete len:265 (+) Transcript_31996:1152-1946(+)